MKILIPTQIATGDIIDLSVPAEAIEAYSKTTEYCATSKCISLLSGIPHVFEWLPPIEDATAKSRGTDPAKRHVIRQTDMRIDVKSTHPKYKRYWLDRGPTNRFAMLDQQTGTPTTGVGSITLSFAPAGLVTGLALVKMTNVASVYVTVIDTSTEEICYQNGLDDVFDIWGWCFSDPGQSLANMDDIVDIWSWCFVPPDHKDEFILTDLPPVDTAKIIVTAESYGDVTLSIGELVCGEVVDIGTLKYGASASYKAWRYQTINDAGEEVLRGHLSRKTTSYAVRVPTDRLGYVKRMMQRVIGLPTIYIGDEHHDMTVVYGICDSFNEILSGFTSSVCDLTVAEMVGVSLH